MEPPVDWPDQIAWHFSASPATRLLHCCRALLNLPTSGAAWRATLPGAPALVACCALLAAPLRCACLNTRSMALPP